MFASSVERYDGRLKYAFEVSYFGDVFELMVAVSDLLFKKENTLPTLLEDACFPTIKSMLL